MTVNAEQQQSRTPYENEQKSDLVIDAGWVLVDDNSQQSIRRDASIIIRDGEIADITEGRYRGTEDRVDATNCLVVPGLISGHTHTTASSPSRGLIEGGRYMDRPMEVIEEIFTDDEIDALTEFNLGEMLRSGCTTYVEMSTSLRQAESFVRVASRWGVRAYVSVLAPSGNRLFDIWFRADDQVLHDSVAGTLTEIEQNVEFGRRINGMNGDLIRAQMGAHAADTHTPETLAAVKAAADEFGNGMHIHLVQRKREIESVERVWGMRPIAWLESLGLLNDKLIGAHLYQADPEDEFPVLKHYGVNFAHCPCMASVLHQASQPYPEALAAGLNTMLGLDQISNDYMENIKLAVLNGQLRASLLNGTSSAPIQKPTIEDAIWSATRGGAAALHRDDLGRIQVGAKADITCIDISSMLTGLGALPPDPLNNLLYANGNSVRHVITEGRMQVRDGRLVVADHDKVQARGGAIHQKMWDALDSEGWFDKAPPVDSRG